VPAAVVRMRGAIRSYPWGSHEVIARLQGRPAPTVAPEAELWFGTHPDAPATVEFGDGRHVAADTVVQGDPEHWLGASVAARFGPRLPFLVKILAIAAPLSLQVHPAASAAREGFRLEEAAGIPRRAPHRVFRDPYGKPELLTAITPVAALCGLRSPDAAASVLRELAVPVLAPVRDALTSGSVAALRHVLTWPPNRRRDVVAEVAAAARRVTTSGVGTPGVVATCAAVGDLAERYPDDPGVLAALLLEQVRLAPGEALHVPPGVLHCYLRGEGVEVMAASDNVVRGGLTAKPVDVERLLEHVAVDGEAGSVVRPVTRGDEVAYPVPTTAFRLTRIDVGDPVRLDPEAGPQVFLATAGELRVGCDDEAVTLDTADAALVAAGAGPVHLAGSGRLYRVRVADTG
jgi:mannose-6-phosphate isomerase